MNWLDNKKDDNPFFLYVAFTEVHSPLASPKKYLDMYSQYMTDYQKQHPDLFYGDWADKTVARHRRILRQYQLHG